MIKAIIFDLDGTLVQTEPLKCLAYARAALELSSDSLSREEVAQACQDLIGVSDAETALTLIQRFRLEDAAQARMAELGVDTSWQAFMEMQMRIYNQMVDDPGVLRREQLPHNIALLHEARQNGYKTALATLSSREQTSRLLGMLGLSGAFDFVATQDDVKRPKPDPEIYQLVAQELTIHPSECLVLEDSPTGVGAALAAGMWCIAVPSSLTSQAVHAAGLLDKRWIVDDPATVKAVVQRMIAEQQLD